mgnify:CR=1 FL=1
MYQVLTPSRSSTLALRHLNYHVRHWGPEHSDLPTLVLLHGWMDVSASYQFTVDALRQPRRIIAPDWRGFGLTTGAPVDHYVFADYLADLDLLLDHYAPGEAIDLVGHSMGGNVAMMYGGVRPERVRKLISPAVDLLAGIPSIIYGFFGMIIIRPFIAQLTGGLGFGALTAWFVLAIMIVPTITTLTIDALNSIPMGIREASYAMGATKWQTIYKVVLPAAKLGIVDAIVLGMGRAIGETMAVLMVVGNAPVIPDSIASPISTLTSQIALDMSYSSGLHRSALFGMGVVLFIISATLVGIVRLISKKKRG